MPAVKKTATKTAPRKTKKSLTPEQQYRKIEAEAYFLAEKDGFQKNPVEYWLAAEATVGA